METFLKEIERHRTRFFWKFITFCELPFPAIFVLIFLFLYDKFSAMYQRKHNIVLSIGNKSIELSAEALLYSSIVSTILFLCIFYIFYIHAGLRKVYTKKFSFFVKQKFLNSIRDLLPLEGIEIIEYRPKDQILKKFFSEHFEYFNIYHEEDIFMFKVNNINVLMCQVEIASRFTGYRTYVYEQIYKGLVYRISNQIKIHESPSTKEEIIIIKDTNYTYVLRKNDKDLFQLKLFKKTNIKTFKKFLNEIRENILFIAEIIK